MTISAVLWDVDDTLFDHSGAERQGALEFLAAEGLLARYASPEAAAGHWHAVSEEWVERYLAGELSFRAQRRERARVLADLPGMTDAEADAWFAGYLAAYRRHWRAFPDVRPALDSLRGRYRHGVLSNNATHQQDSKLRAVGLRDRFEVLACSEELGVAKPDAAAFHAACAALGVPPEETAYVGDRWDVDAAGADAAGLMGVWLDREGGAGPRELRRIGGLGELAGVLSGPRPG
ncbi:HAD family hydrolase [Streptomyces sp. A7024]|uniref:HAD family hydrolase n=1 Tax=Streptomyces coryli TaxID=1128680 RepID=A0A6G4U0J4_9ACTN|nr:HAD family hydrolase [Streptomyces coryli]NGN65755.1 HAD family hydrolase [Streptomyces coryli]